MVKCCNGNKAEMVQLQFIYGVKLYERQSVIIFDEIQKCPKAREAIKYLVKDHRSQAIEAYIETNNLSDKLSADFGYVYENIVAQMLAASGHKLFYHTWRNETSNHIYEIDFLLSQGAKLCPLEVKASGYNTHTSFDEFCRKFSKQIGSKYLIYTKDLRKDQDLTLLPVMMTMFL